MRLMTPSAWCGDTAAWVKTRHFDRGWFDVLGIAIMQRPRQEPSLFTRLLDNFEQVRVAVDSRLNRTMAQPYVLNDSAIAGDIEEWFRVWWDGVNPGALAVGIRLLGLRTLTFGELTAEEYRASGNSSSSSAPLHRP
jgi:hypothetical protein